MSASAVFEHDFERDPKRPRWKGWHAFRRSLASNLNRLGVDDEVIQRILRHSNVTTTQMHYIKTSGPEVLDAMQKLELELARKAVVQQGSDSHETASSTLGTHRKSVN
jgi:hypothetical protein